MDCLVTWLVLRVSAAQHCRKDLGAELSNSDIATSEFVIPGASSVSYRRPGSAHTSALLESRCEYNASPHAAPASTWCHAPS